MRRRPSSDGLTTAYLVYVTTWLGSWPTRRRLRRARVRRSSTIPPPEPPGTEPY